MTLDGSAASFAAPDTSDWQQYSGLIRGNKTSWSSATRAYGSIDPAGHQEAMQTEDLE